jgi:hypothetical protein
MSVPLIVAITDYDHFRDFRLGRRMEDPGSPDHRRLSPAWHRKA